MWATLFAFFFPKLLWDWLTTTLNVAVKPFPILQIISMVLAASVFALEWPFPGMTSIRLGSFHPHSSIAFRLLYYPAVALTAALLYQGTEAAGFYIIAMSLYFWAYCEGEVVLPEPWALPRKVSRSSRPVAPTLVSAPGPELLKSGATYNTVELTAPQPAATGYRS